LPRSSWADYDATLISEGGGIHPRTAKSITITAQVAAVLGLQEGATMTPSDLMKAVLCAPVDLLWNGGIGTYVKSSAEANSDVGDKGNDAIRINGADLRVKVVGEGGNLGLTQLGRIEAALSGVRINTDAIDNSAGVDCSDHEVNIKILLGQVVAAGDLTIKQRNELLAAMTDDVGRLVLRDNYEQNVLLGNARRQSDGMLVVHQRLIHSMEADGFLNRELEFLPSDAHIEDRAQQDLGLTSPEFAVLVAYAKIRLKQQILDSTIPDEPFFQRRLRDYFPPVLVERYGDVMADHQLRRQIIATSVANDLVNRGGITFAYRAVEETGAAADQVVRAFTVAREVFGLDDYVAQVEALDNVVDCDLQADLYLEFRRLIDRAARWVLQNRPGRIDVQEEIDMFAPVAQQWRGRMTELLSGADLQRVERAVHEQVSQGVPAELSARSCALLDEFSLLDVAELADDLGQPVQRIADVHFAISDVFGLDWMLTRISRLPRMNRWEALARGAMRDDLYGAWMGLTKAVLGAGRRRGGRRHRTDSGLGASQREPDRPGQAHPGRSGCDAGARPVVDVGGSAGAAQRDQVGFDSRALTRVGRWSASPGRRRPRWARGRLALCRVVGGAAAVGCSRAAGQLRATFRRCPAASEHDSAPPALASWGVDHVGPAARPLRAVPRPHRLAAAVGV
jgi:glutamate dehydrogenase